MGAGHLDRLSLIIVHGRIFIVTQILLIIIHIKLENLTTVISNTGSSVSQQSYNLRTKEGLTE